MHHDGVHAHLFQQRDIAAEFACKMLLAHGVATVFDHDGGTRIATQEWQCLRQYMRPFGGGGSIDRDLVHAAPCTGAGPEGQAPRASATCTVKWNSAPPPR